MYSLCDVTSTFFNLLLLFKGLEPITKFFSAKLVEKLRFYLYSIYFPTNNFKIICKFWGRKSFILLPRWELYTISLNRKVDPFLLLNRRQNVPNNLARVLHYSLIFFLSIYMVTSYTFQNSSTPLATLASFPLLNSPSALNN